MTNRSEVVGKLRALLRERRRRCEPLDDSEAASWNRLVGGVGPRRLVDCLTASPGSGGGLVALSLCMRACRRGGELVVVDRSATLHPPTAVAWGVDAKRLLIVSPTTEADALTAVETALRSPAVGAVWASLGAIDNRAFRRLLLAAEAGTAFGALVRPARYEPQPSWGDVQLRFTAVPTANDHRAPFLVHVTQTRNRHGPARGEALLAIDWKSNRIEQQPLDTHTPSYAPRTDKNALRLVAGLAGAARRA